MIAIRTANIVEEPQHVHCGVDMPKDKQLFVIMSAKSKMTGSLEYAPTLDMVIGKDGRCQLFGGGGTINYDLELLDACMREAKRLFPALA